MRIIAVMNSKGGACKTTTAVNLAAALGERGRSVLLVDLDPSANATTYLGVQGAQKELLAALLGSVFPSPGPASLADIARQSSAPGVSIVPSSRWLDNVERVMRQVGVDSEEDRIGALNSLLRKLPSDDWDYVFLDCPPTFGFLVQSALRATDEILVPVEVSSSALPGLRDLFLTIRAAAPENPRLRLAGILPCRVLVVGLHWAVVCREIVEDLRSRFGEVVFRHVIRESVKLRETLAQGLPITIYDPDGNGAADYRATAAELEKRSSRAFTEAPQQEMTHGA